MADEKKLPWGLKPDTLAPGSMKTISESKLKAFQVGRMNPLKGKSNARIREEEKKKREEAAAAEVYEEYLADFQTAGAKAKTFVRANVVEGKPVASSEAGKLYNPTSKIAELAREFTTKEAAAEAQSKPESGRKKKEKEKKKSNLEMFKEELEKNQLEREIRHKIKKGDITGIPDDVLTSLPPGYFKQQPNRDPNMDDFNMNYGSHDVGDPTTTNLYIGNINPKMNEEMLCKVFGKYGPLASVKIMWPRTDEEKARNRNCGFVAFMSRKDGEKALKELLGQDIMSFEMKLGWGKPVPIPPQPIYVPPEMVEAQLPPPPSGLPFNGQILSKYKGNEFDGNLENTVVKVIIPTERAQLAVINRVCEFVVREGPMFEAMIMNREINNILFRFLFENKSPEHVYYRWRLFSLLQGDTPQQWSQVEFRMFKGGSVWKPPSMNPYSMTSMGQASSQALASASSAIAHSGLGLPLQVIPSEIQDGRIPIASVLPMQDDDSSKKNSLSDRQRDRLEDMLRMLTTDRSKIGDLMVWCLDHADCADEIVECITESLSLEETPMSTKIARLYVVNDILYNSSAKVANASFFRKGFESKLPEIMKHVRLSYTSAASKSQAEKFRKQVLSCLAAWQDWSVYQPGFLIKLQNVFVGLSNSLDEDVTPNEVSDLDGLPLDKMTDDLDGMPIVEADPDLDGMPLSKSDDIDGFPLSKKDDIDGAPMEFSDIDGAPIFSSTTSKGDFMPSRWENVTDKSPEKTSSKLKSRWDGDGVEPSNSGVESKWQKLDAAYTAISPDSHSSHDSPSVHAAEIDESKRRFLREVEVKVVRFSDRIEASGGLKSGASIKEECERYRQKLLEDYERSRQRKAAKSRRHRSGSNSPSTPRRKRGHKARSQRSNSISSEDGSDDSDANDDLGSPGSLQTKKRRSHAYSPTNSQSPSPKRSSKKKKKKTKR